MPLRARGRPLRVAPVGLQPTWVGSRVRLLARTTEPLGRDLYREPGPEPLRGSPRLVYRQTDTWTPPAPGRLEASGHLGWQPELGRWSRPIRGGGGGVVASWKAGSPGTKGRALWAGGRGHLSRRAWPRGGRRGLPGRKAGEPPEPKGGVSRAGRRGPLGRWAWPPGSESGISKAGRRSHQTRKSGGVVTCVGGWGPPRPEGGASELGGVASGSLLRADSGKGDRTVAGPAGKCSPAQSDAPTPAWMEGSCLSSPPPATVGREWGLLSCPICDTNGKMQVFYERGRKGRAEAFGNPTRPLPPLNL